MAQTIWKLPLPMADELRLQMPQGAEILCVQLQAGIPTIWVRCDDDPAFAGRVHRVLQWRGTGHNADGTGAYVGTVQLEGGALVFHLFDKGEE